MISNRDEFIQKYWNYYCMLENDFIEITRYIDIRETNYKTSSEIIIKQLQSVASEFEVVCKELGNLDMSSKVINIKNYYEVIKSYMQDVCKELNLKNFRDIEINVRRTNRMKIKPLNNWDKNKTANLFWWKGYNEVKHSRTENFEKGNFENLLNALGALYLLEKLLLRKISFKTKQMDVPDTKSNLFYINGWKVKWLEYYDEEKKWI